MKRLFLAAAVLATCATAQTFATEAVAPASKPHELTVREAINVAIGLRALDRVNNGKIDAGGNQVSEPTGFKFSSGTLLTIAIDLNHVDQASTIYQQAKNTLIRQLSGNGVSVPNEKQAEFLAENDKMLDAPARVLVTRIKNSELCLDATAPCTQANAIPGSTLSLLVPILDSGK